MLNPEVHQALTTILQEHGRVILSDPARLESLLRESASGHTREVNLLTNALRAGIPQSLSTAGTAADRAALAKKLEDEMGTAPDAAASAVDAWATALGMPSMPAVEAPMPSFDAVAPSVSEPVVAAPPVTAAPVAPAPPAPAPVTAPVAPTVTAPPVAAPPAMEIPSVAAPAAQPAPGHGGVPPQGQPNPYAYQQQQPAPSRSNSGLMVIIAIFAVIVIGGGGAAWYFSNKAKANLATTANQFQQGLQDAINKNTPPVTTDTGGTNGATAAPTPDLASYNEKAGDIHKRLDAASTEFGTQTQTFLTTLQSATDKSPILDQMGQLYLDYSAKLEVFASEYDAMSPPTEAVEVHNKFAQALRKLSSLFGEGAQAFKSHDGAQMTQKGQEIEDATKAMDNDINASLDTQGFNHDKFHNEGILVKG